mmetsp:Transcript_82918/g.173617  ORF Transcript_82918/g.173617 Transcript_82918/m.173617 type:complete len:257 (+) Transcript_82918:707-1477(+)
MELDVTRSQGFLLCGTRPDVASINQFALGRVVAELSDQIHSEVRHIGDSPENGIQDHSMGVRIRLTLGLGGVVVLGVVHVLVVAGLHGSAVVWVVEGSGSLLNGSDLLVHTEDTDGGIPIIDHQHVVALTVQREVARGGSTGTSGPSLAKAAGVWADLPSCDLARLGDGLRASVEDVLLRMKPRKSWVHHDILAHGEQHHLAVEGVHAKGVQTPLRLCAARTMRQVVESGIAGHYDELLSTSGCLCGDGVHSESGV